MVSFSCRDLKYKQIFFKNFLIFSILFFVFFKNTNAMETDLYGDGFEQEFDIAAKEFDQIKKEFNDSIPTISNIKNEFDDFLEDIDLNDSGWFKDFRNKVLFSLPINERSAYGIYGADVLKFVFFFSYIYLDKILFDRLKAYYQQNILVNFKSKQDALIDLYSEKVSFKSFKNFVNDEKARKLFIDECLIILDLKKGLNYKLFSYISFNLFGKEGVKFVEHKVFPVKNSSFLDLFKQMDSVAKKIDKEKQFVISVYPVINMLLTLSLLGLLPTLEENIRSARAFLYKLSGWDYKFLDIYGIDLSRRMLILILFLNRLNLWYQTLFEEYLMQNLGEFLKILSDMGEFNFSDDKNFNGGDEALKDFIKQGMDCSFKKWFTYKTECCAKLGILMEGIFLLPVMVKGGYFIYNNIIRKA